MRGTFSSPRGHCPESPRAVLPPEGPRRAASSHGRLGCSSVRADGHFGADLATTIMCWSLLCGRGVVFLVPRSTKALPRRYISGRAARRLRIAWTQSAVRGGAGRPRRCVTSSPSCKVGNSSLELVAPTKEEVRKFRTVRLECVLPLVLRTGLHTTLRGPA